MLDSNSESLTDLCNKAQQDQKRSRNGLGDVADTHHMVTVGPPLQIHDFLWPHDTTLG